jgi:hypothetical protein
MGNISWMVPGLAAGLPAWRAAAGPAAVAGPARHLVTGAGSSACPRAGADR